MSPLCEKRTYLIWDRYAHVFPRAISLPCLHISILFRKDFAMTHVKTERINLQQIPMSQRKHIGLLCQRHMEAKSNTGMIESLRILLQSYIDAHRETETKAARWMLARMVADPLADQNCRQYICELLYG